MRDPLQVLLILLSLLISGCGSYYSYIDSAVDPGYLPAKSNPLYVTLSSKPSIRERQLMVSLKSELCRNKFVVVDSIAESTWTLGLSVARETFETGVTSTATAIPGITPGSTFVVGSAQRNVQTNQYAQLHLFKSSEFSIGKQLPIWEGQVAARNDLFEYYESTIFKSLLDVYGKNFSDATKIDKKYFDAVTQCSQVTSASADCACGPKR